MIDDVDPMTVEFEFDVDLGTDAFVVDDAVVVDVAVLVDSHFRVGIWVSCLSSSRPWMKIVPVWK